MLSFLLDEHVSPDVALIVRRSRPEIPVFALLDWQNGIWIGESDEEILRAAGVKALTVVTYDQRTFPRLLQRWADSKQTHAGVVFVDERTIAPNDLPELARSLILLWDEHRDLGLVESFGVLTTQLMMRRTSAPLPVRGKQPEQGALARRVFHRQIVYFLIQTR